MPIPIRKSLQVMLLSYAVGMLSSPAEAALIVVLGRPVAVYADLSPSDVVVEMDVKGPCGSPYFHIQRASVIFKELTAVALTAFSAGKSMTFFVDPALCMVDRNVVDHGGAW
jgi:hypothetical protein